MGGQACVLYGGAEFSCSTDIALLGSDENLERLRVSLHELGARSIALPPFELEYLLRGHAVHFRCYHPEAMKTRVDVMSLMRGVDPFDKLWERRRRIVGGRTKRAVPSRSHQRQKDTTRRRLADDTRTYSCR